MRFFEYTPEGTNNCRVRAWLHTNIGNSEIVQRQYPAVLICPGGGYQMVSEREAEPVAERYFAAGFNAFILNYSVGEQAKNFEPLIQLAYTIAQIRSKSEEWVTDPNRIAVCGFSAGGHLACSLGTLFNDEKFANVFTRDTNIRPDAMILCYPVITADENAHVESIETVSGGKKGSSKYEWFGLDQHVDNQTPPTFLWHTAEDACVPVENSLKMASALSVNKVPFELHIFPYGKHGMSVCSEQVKSESVYNGRWLGMSIEWLKLQFHFTY